MVLEVVSLPTQATCSIMKLHSPWVMERLGATAVSFGAVIGNCEKYLGATIRVFIWCSKLLDERTCGKVLLWKIQSRSKSYSCPPRQSFTFTCISENRQIWLNLVLWFLQQLNLIFYPMIYGVVYMQGGVGFQLSTLALQRLVPKVWFLLCLYKPYMRKVWNDVSISAWQKLKSCPIRDVTSQREVFSVAVGCSDLIGHDGCSTGNKRDLAELFKWVSERRGTGPIHARLEAEEK